MKNLVWKETSYNLVVVILLAKTLPFTNNFLCPVDRLLSSTEVKRVVLGKDNVLNIKCFGNLIL